MYDLVSIGDVKLDVFISLDQCLHKCNLKEKKVSFDFSEKISVQVLDQQTAGSAPNVATALSRMNFKTAVISNMGQDQTYLQAQRDLSSEGVDIRFITPHKGINSAYSAVLTLQGEKTILASYILKQYKLPKRLATKWMFVSEMGNGYDKLFRQVIKFMKKGNTKLALNPGNQQIADLKPELYDLIAVTDMLFVNVGEGREILKSKKIGVPQMAKRLFKMGPDEVIITDGRDGAYGYDGKTLWKLPIFPAKRVEATGAGDSFAAAYIGARLNGKGMEEGLMWGAVNSAEVVQHVGPVPGLLKHTQILSRLKKNKSFRPTAL
jgi:sugar/nucleoside kinase (ribokinase family)